MNVEDLRAKGVKDLNDEQKQFLAEHKSELTDDERAKFGLVVSSRDALSCARSSETSPFRALASSGAPLSTGAGACVSEASVSGA